MATFSGGGGGYGRHLRGRGKRVMHAMQQMATEVAKDVEQEGLAKLSGNVSTATFRKLGHPMGRKRGRKWSQANRVRMSAKGAIPKLPINIQKGNLKRSAKMRRTQFGGKWTMGTSYAKFVLSEDGTSKSVPRGYVQHMRRVLKVSMKKHKATVVKAIHQ
jgi:hypothetical protein